MAGEWRRGAVLTIAVLLAACSTQALAPRDSAPSVSPTAVPSATNASTDLLYVRAVGSGGAGSIVAIDARTGMKVRELPNGVLSADRSQLYWAESVSGATETVVHVTDFATGDELRSFKVDGGYHTLFADNAPGGLSSDGRWLAVWGGEPHKLNGNTITRFAIIDLHAGAIASRIEFSEQSGFGYTGLSPDGKRLYLTQFGEGTTRLRVYDISTKTLLPDGILGIEREARPLGFRGSPIASADGRTLFTVNTVQGAGPTFILGLDLAAGRAFRVLLPEQHTTDWEKELLWSLALSADGTTLYALNPGVGVVNEIDVERQVLRRTGRIAAGRADRVPSAVERFFFPVAEAKRYLRGSALLSPDGRAIYAIADKGVLLIDTATLAVRETWRSGEMFGSLALSPDGARLYAISDEAQSIAIMDARTGASLGAVRMSGWVQNIVRIDISRS